MASLHSQSRDEKQLPYESSRIPFPEPRLETHPRRRQLIQRVIPAVLMLFALCSLFRSTFVYNHRYSPSLTPWRTNVLDEEEKVPLEIHIMSKCPDARDCLQKLIVPTMVEVSEKVNFTMSFIGR